MTAHARSLGARYTVELVRRAEGPRWVILDTIENRHVSTLFSSRSAAVEARKERIATEADRRKMGSRPCMCCGQVFDSQGIHNRLCQGCRADTPAREMVGAGQPAIVSAGRR